MHLSIIALSFVLVLISSQTALGYYEYNTTLEDQFGNPVYQIDYNGSKLIATNILNKTIFNEGETITVIPEVMNLGNQTVNIGYDPPLFSIEVKDQHGKTVGLSGGGHLLVNFGMTLKPNMSSPSYAPAGMQKGVFMLTSGNYSIISMASFYNFTNSTGSDLLLWSEPTQIAVVPEFPFAIPILLISIVSVIVFYRVKVVK